MTQDKLALISKGLPSHCTLIAVSKTKPSADILDAYHTGHRHFGENKVQELSEKATELPKDIKWHMIGHLQRNKVRHIAPFVHLIHGVDSLRLLNEINKQAVKCERIIDCLLQVHIASENTKFGFGKDEIEPLLTGNELVPLKNIRIAGLMGMATNTKNTIQVSEEFRALKTVYDWTKKNITQGNINFSFLSMGMSNDYETAIQEGSNMVRIGSLIFGERNY